MESNKSVRKSESGPKKGRSPTGRYEHVTHRDSKRERYTWVRTYERGMNRQTSLKPEKDVDRENKFIGVFPDEVFNNSQTFINSVRKGVSGRMLKEIIQSTGQRKLWSHILNVDSSNLSKLYARARLDREASEDVLDSVRVLNQAAKVWESLEMAIEWLNSEVPALANQVPIELFDTAEGRRWISQVLTHVEHGEFS